MKRLTILNSLGCALVAIVIFAGLPAMAKEKEKPNVVFILADNVGYGDMGPYGGGELRGAPTPNIDRLAREGIHRFEERHGRGQLLARQLTKHSVDSL